MDSVWGVSVYKNRNIYVDNVLDDGLFSEMQSCTNYSIDPY